MAQETRDLSHYDLLDRFTLRQAAHLWVGEDPLMPTPGDERWRAVAQALAADDGPWEPPPSYLIEGEEPCSLSVPETGEVVPGSVPKLTVDIDRTYVSRADLAAWARKRGSVPKFIAKDVAALSVVADGESSVPAPSSPPEPARHTREPAERRAGRGSTPPNSKWIDNAEAAASVGCKPTTLDRWRVRGFPPLPAAQRKGRQVMYVRAEWEAFAARYLAGEFNKKRRR